MEISWTVCQCQCQCQHRAGVSASTGAGAGANRYAGVSCVCVEVCVPADVSAGVLGFAWDCTGSMNIRTGLAPNGNSGGITLSVGSATTGVAGR